MANTKVKAEQLEAAQTNITSLGTLTALQVDNININGNTISSTDTNGNIIITPNGTGKIGIGVASPQAALHIEVADNTEFLKATITGNEQWAFKGASGSGAMDYVSFGISGGTQAMAWQEDGNVGIGNTAPATARLHVDYLGHTDAYTATAFLEKQTIRLRHPNGATYYGGIGFSNDAGNYEWFTGSHQTGSTTADYVIQGADSASTYSEAVRIKSNGNTTIHESLLVGTETAYDKLAVLRTSTSQTAGMTLLNTQNGGYGSGITWESKRSDANNIQTAGRISVQGYNSWNSDGTASSQMIFQLRHGNTLSDVLKVQNGNLVFPTQGKGIDFGATSSGNYALQTGGSASSTVLDDYEEGTWTPVVAAATGTTVHRAGYVKIGQLVFIQFYWNGTFATSGDPQYVTGLPYVAASVTNNYCALSLAYCDDANLNDCMPITNHNGSAFIYFHQNDGSGATLTRNDFNSRGCNNLIISGCYYANS